MDRAERHYKAWLKNKGYTDTWLGGFSQKDESGWTIVFNASPLLVEWALQDEGFLSEAKTNRGGIRSLKFKERPIQFCFQCGGQIEKSACDTNYAYIRITRSMKAEKFYLSELCSLRFQINFMKNMEERNQSILERKKDG